MLLFVSWARWICGDLAGFWGWEEYGEECIRVSSIPQGAPAERLGPLFCQLHIALECVPSSIPYIHALMMAVKPDWH